MKMKIGTLLAVTLATTAPAFAFPKAHRGITKPKPVAAKPAPKPAASPVAVAPVAAKPRTLPSGAPACGNVQSKMSPAQAAARDAACAERK
ncbi:MAG: hypothetical protein H0T65_08905 [Deltaproteobacteria bacterium]|nr:hypothetical protein [Deltaproteobacteria bacterium]